MKITRNEKITNLHCMKKIDLSNQSLNYESQKPNLTNKLPPVNQQNVAANNYAVLQDGEWIKNNYQELRG